MRLLVCEKNPVNFAVFGLPVFLHLEIYWKFWTGHAEKKNFSFVFVFLVFFVLFLFLVLLRSCFPFLTIADNGDDADDADDPNWIVKELDILEPVYVHAYLFMKLTERFCFMILEHFWKKQDDRSLSEWIFFFFLSQITRYPPPLPRKRRAALRNQQSLWRGGVIPYIIQPSAFGKELYILWVFLLVNHVNLVLGEQKLPELRSVLFSNCRFFIHCAYKGGHGGLEQIHLLELQWDPFSSFGLQLLVYPISYVRVSEYSAKSKLPLWIEPQWSNKGVKGHFWKQTKREDHYGRYRVI